MQPGAKKTRVVGKLGDDWKIAVKAPPVEGKANDGLVRFLGEQLDLPRSAITITSGRANRRKTVAVEGLTEDQIDKLLGS